MTELISEWITQLYNDAIEKAKADISNYHLWELGYDGEEPNPHTEQIENLKQYIETLEDLRDNLRGI